MAQPSASLERKAGPGLAADLVATAQTDGNVRVIVHFATPAAGAIQADAAGIAVRTTQVAGARNAIVATHFRDVTDAAAAPGFNRCLTGFPLTSGFAVNGTARELEALAADPRIVSIHPDRLNEPTLNESVPLIGMPAAYALGATGSGYTVAVLDTGIKANHEFLAGKVVDEACFSAGGGGLGLTLCPNGTPSQTGAGAADANSANCNVAGAPAGDRNLCYHGTHVAGIAAGFNTSQSASEPPYGVAKSSQILAVQVFTRFNGATSCKGAANCVRSLTSDLISGLDYVLANATPGGSPVIAVNMSLGGGLFSGACDSDPLKPSIDNLRAAGILTVAAAGNDGSTSQIASPACISSVLSVASTRKTPFLSTFTDISEQVSVLAPGGENTGACTQTGSQLIYAPVVTNGGSAVAYDCLVDTSMVAPHVAGAVASIKSACPAATAAQIQSALVNTGLLMRDVRIPNGVVKPRVRVDLAVQQACSGVSVVRNTANLPANAPTITINGTGFNAVTPGANIVTFADTSALGNATTGIVTAATTTQLTVTFTSPRTAGALLAIVVNGAGTSAAPMQVATVAPVITANSANILPNDTLTIDGFGTVTAATNTQLTVTPGAPWSVGPLRAQVVSFNVPSGLTQVATVVGDAGGFTVAAPPSTTAGALFDATITAIDNVGAVNAGYTGTVRFTSSDPLATLVPTLYTFTAPDNGVHVHHVTLRTAGTQTITATDTSNGSILGIATVNVSPTIPFQVTANAGVTPQGAPINTAFAVPLAVTVRDEFNNPISGVSVDFVAPASGASGKFSNNATTLSLVTNASGVTSTPFTANAIVGGPYDVTVTAAGIISPIALALTNLKTPQTISFDKTPKIAAIGRTYTPNATATSGLPVTLSVDAASAGVCVLAAGVVTYNALGDCILKANQAGDSVFAAAPQAQQTLQVKLFNEISTPNDAFAIATGPDGSIWYTEDQAGHIGRISMDGDISSFTPPTLSSLSGIAVGPDGAIWFGEWGKEKIGRVTTAGVFTEFTYPRPLSRNSPAFLTAGPDGATWFTLDNGSKIGRMTPAGDVTMYPLLSSAVPYGIAAGPDGALWFTEFGLGRIGRITTAGAVSEFALPNAGSKPYAIAAGPDGALWFTLYGTNAIGRITTAGVITEFPIPTANSQPVGIVAGPDGALWFTEFTGNKLGRITPAGDITEFLLPTPLSGPYLIATRPDGALWYTIFSAVGHFTPQAPALSVTPSTAILAAGATTLVINGSGFDASTPGNNIVTFTSGAAGTVTAATATQLTVTFSTKPQAGPLKAFVSNGSGDAGAFPQVATVIPVVTPDASHVLASATVLTINGFGFSPTPANNVVTVSSGTASVSAATATQLTLNVAGLSPGALTAQVTVNGQASGAAVQVATIVTSIPATMSANVGATPQSASINAVFANPLGVTILDASNTPVSGAIVTFAAPGAGASGLFANAAIAISVTSDGSGVASAPFTANGAAGGPYNVTATAPGLASVVFTLTNQQGAQTIAFTSPAPGNARKGGATYTPTATASSGLPVTLAVAPASAPVCAIAAGVISFTGPGVCTVNANQAGNANYAAAPQVQQSFFVRPGAPHDLNADAMSDILLRDAAGNVSAWLVSNGALVNAQAVGQAPANWTIQGTADFNGDGKSDILWRETGGQTAVWFMNGASVTSAPLYTFVTPNWTIVGTGDFNGDGKTDILWRETNGALAIWLLDGAGYLDGQIISAAPAGWTIAGIGDFDGDGKSDILWRHTSGLMSAWFMNGLTITSSPLVGSVSSNWTIAGVGDFNNDGKADIVWRETSGVVAVWLLNNFTLLSAQVVGSAPVAWSIEGVGDFNNDGKTDVVWRGPAGEVALWMMNGTTLVAGPQIGAAPLTTVIQRMTD